MKNLDCIVVTGAAGFIGSVLVGYLNELGFENLILVDDFSIKAKADNLIAKKYTVKVHREQFMGWLKEHPNSVSSIFHLGARTDTTLQDEEVFKTLNYRYSKDVWEYCSENKIPLVYASSAATYGNGEHGYTDNQAMLELLKPLNPYGLSKHKFDIWALAQPQHPPFWAGLKFFNVYGPNEYHKGRMASVIFHAVKNLPYNANHIKLFRSHVPEFENGGQMRDFIYVMDLVKVCVWLMENQPESAIFNLGTGKARTFNDLAHSVFAAMNLPEEIDYIDTPADIRDAYQYYTEADMSKLRAAGYAAPFTELEDGVKDYVCNYLKEGKVY